MKSNFKAISLSIVALCATSVAVGSLAFDDTSSGSVSLKTTKPMKDKLTAYDRAALHLKKTVKKSSTLDAASEAAGGTLVDGPAVMTWVSLNYEQPDGGGSVTLRKVSDDSVVIDGFYSPLITVGAHLDAAGSKLIIHPSVVADVEGIGKLEICQTNYDNEKVEGDINATIGDNGKITFEDMWAIMVADPNVADNVVYAAQLSAIAPANGIMEISSLRTEAPAKHNVVISPDGDDALVVSNFGGHGCDVRVNLNPNATISIPSQTAMYGEYGTVYSTYPADWDKMELYSRDIVGKATPNELSFGSWTIYYSNEEYVYGLTGAKIYYNDSTNVKFALPTLDVSGFEGKGTAEEPYLISQFDHLKLLAAEVKTSPDFLSHKDVHYKLTNDIQAGEMKSIGGDFHMSLFDGSLDGDGHTISGLVVDGGSKGFGGLFGSLGPDAVIENLNLKDVSISASYYYCGGLAAYGQGATIRNCHVTGTVSNNGQYAGGIVGGMAEGGKVISCSFEGSVNAAKGDAGGIASAFNGTMADCHASGMVKMTPSYNGMNSVGGVVGYLYGDGSSLSASYFSGHVEAVAGGMRRANYVGGLVGNVSGASVSESFSVGEVYGSNDYTAGLIGYLKGNASDVYSAASVHDTTSARKHLLNPSGGITAYITAIYDNDGTVHDVELKNAYFAGNLDLYVDGYMRDESCIEIAGACAQHTVLTNVYYDNTVVTGFNSSENGMSGKMLVSDNGIAGFSSDIWEFGGGMYPRLKKFSATAESQVSASAVVLDADCNDRADKVTNAAILGLGSGVAARVAPQGDVAAGTISNGKYVPGDSFATDSIIISSGSASKYVVLNVAPALFAGKGTEASPYEISREDDLVKLADAVNNHLQPYHNTWFRQMNDIVLGDGSSFKGIGSSVDADYAEVMFAGHYDGNGHTVDNLMLDYVDTAGTPLISASSGNKGFVGNLAPDGEVCGLTIGAKSRLNAAANAGAVVGVNNGYVHDCCNFAPVAGYSNNVGGIVGLSNNGASVVRCYNAASVAGNASYVGGIVGKLAGSLSECMNIGTVAGKNLSTSVKEHKNVGGIAGWASQSSIVDVVNAGNVYGDSYVAGIVGCNDEELYDDWTGARTPAANSISRAMNYGTVIAVTKALSGAVAGDGASSGTIDSSVADSQISGTAAVGNAGHDGVASVATSSLTGGALPAGFGEALWTAEAGSYPYLTRYKNLDGVKEAVAAVITVADGETVAELISNAALAKTATWTLAKGDRLSIKDNMLCVPGELEDVVNDTIHAVAGIYSKYIPLKAVPGLSLAGNGSENNPYLIKTPADWMTVGSYMLKVGTEYSGKHFSIPADIDFAGFEGLAPIGTADNAFNGVIDGGGHAFKGINLTSTGENFALVTRLGSDGVIRGLNAEGTLKSEKFDYLGGYVAIMEGTIEDCVSSLTVTNEAGTVGAFAALGKPGARFIKCNNKGVVEGYKGYAGGICGEAESNLFFTDCTNAGSVIDYGSGSRAIAGILGYGKKAKFVRCSNTGVIKGDGATLIAGIYGYANGSSLTETATFVDCSNSSDITAVNNVAGIFGGTSINSAVASKSPVVASGCTNTGNITSTGWTAECGTAGLFAMVSPMSRISECENYGKIVGTGNNNVQYVGGIAGMSYLCGTYSAGNPSPYYARIFNCHNHGDVTGVNGTGGIIGEIDSYVYVDSCSNSGNITSTNVGAGGIAGSVSGHWGCVKNSWNKGNVQAVSNAGGLQGMGNKIIHITASFNTGNVTASNYGAGGLAAESGAYFTNCYNTGTVKAAGYAAGLVASSSYKSNFTGCTDFFSCFNAGKVICDDPETAGAILSKGAGWAPEYGNTQVHSYYVTDYGMTGPDVTGALPVTIAELAALTEMHNPLSDESTMWNKAVSTSAREFVPDYIKDETASAWKWGDAFTLPVLDGVNDNGLARVNAACVVADEGQSLDNITGSFHVGAPEGVVWTASSDAVSLTAGSTDASFVKSCAGPVVLTASDGVDSREWTITGAVTSSIESLDSDSEIVEAIYYTTDGRQIAKPAVPDGNVYIVVAKYAGGAVKTFKVINR